MKLWITGEAGFVARNFADWCQKTDYEFVNRLDNSEYDYWRGYGAVPTKQEIDIFDPVLSTIIASSEADVIIHAADIFDEGNNVEMLRTNIEGTYHVIEAAKKSNLPIIYITTAIDYDNLESIYNFTKFSAEKLLEFSGIKYTIVTPGFLYGKYDENSIIARLMLSAAHKIESAKIDLDPEFMKPFLYIDDFIDALDFILKNLNDLNTEDIHVGSSKYYTVEYVINYITDNFGAPEYEIYPEKDYLIDIMLYNDIISGLGWKQKTSLESGLKKVKKFIEA